MGPVAKSLGKFKQVSLVPRCNLVEHKSLNNA